MVRLRPVLSATPLAMTLALGLTAYGGPTPASGAASSSKSAMTVTVRHVAGVGSVLTDRSGKALYTPQQKTVCTGACTAFWKPLSPGAGAPKAAAGVGKKLGVTTRPDGSSQVTANGKPLYTFSQDASGKVTGNGFKDAFGGHHFTWRVVLAGKGQAAKSGGGGSAPGSNGSNGGSGGYGGSGGAYGGSGY